MKQEDVRATLEESQETEEEKEDPFGDPKPEAMVEKLSDDAKVRHYQDFLYMKLVVKKGRIEMATEVLTVWIFQVSLFALIWQ